MSDKLIALFGPTASGKTRLTEELFSTGFEIINTDSVQVYKGLDIASAKPDEKIMEKIPHHLVNILEPYQQFNSGTFCTMAEEEMKKITARGNIPLITGGTAYYFRQLLYGAASTPKADEEVRAKVNELLEEKGKDWLYSYLEEIDPSSARRINKNDVYRISRAVEVYLTSGKKLSSYKISSTLRSDYDILIIALKRERSELIKRIEARVDEMFSSGLTDEIERLKSMGADLSWPAMNSIGYKEFFLYDDLKTIREKIIIATRQYAKRQMTFFRSFKDAIWLDADDINQISKTVESFLSKAQ
ncbi:MAG TPA: tRNA (adenosine(37)-N6)-dimethylallyltransferase MiaA [Candidatus Ornithospirochaeta avicola]|uniref:tRNA dimethylallyltransferase n=1 Tax=Candidatus Ornithospirochaeta avicola TaxID=2840896 RepID=A0A9D1TNG7_9SPIO|nr:tRNA (adenosine(37)-N6)-dimethylallyltransferase MiaA [Candidatus Ornithospirochaeta avicola]